MRRGRIAALAPVVVMIALGCAPLAEYRGPRPAPGSIAGFARPAGGGDPGSPAPTGAGAFRAGSEPGRPPEPSSRLGPWGADPARHWLGTVSAPAGAESLVILVYGDNRPGYRMETRSVEFREVGNLLTWKSTGSALRGLAFVPLFLVESILPSLDGPRDLVTHFTRRPSAGREQAVLAALERCPAHVVISLGDLVNDGRRGRHWEDFVARHARFRNHTLYLAAPGNHERLWDGIARANWDAAMGTPTGPRRHWYAFDVRPAGPPRNAGAPPSDATEGARFVFLDSDVMADVKRDYPDSLEEAISEEQIAWADSMLAAPARYRFVLFHHPLVSAGKYPADWAPERAARRRARLLEICARRHVTAILCGHEHLYQRVYLRAPDGGGLWQLTTGGGGSPLYRVARKTWRVALARPLPAGLSVEPGSAVMESEYHFCRLTLPLSSAPADRAATLDAGGARRSLGVEVERVFMHGRTARIDAFDLAQPPAHP